MVLKALCSLVIGNGRRKWFAEEIEEGNTPSRAHAEGTKGGLSLLMEHFAMVKDDREQTASVVKYTEKWKNSLIAVVPTKLYRLFQK